MASVGMVPLVEPEEVPADRLPPWVLPLGSGVFVPGRKVDVDRNLVGAQVASLNRHDIQAVEEAWVDLLEFAALLKDPPQFPARGPGGAHPRWGSTYYVNQHTDGERKFYVVITPDNINATAPAVTVVRLTRTERGPEFPEVRRGTYACAGNVTTFPIPVIDQRSTTAVGDVDLDGMRRVAAAIALTHELGEVLSLTERELEELASRR